MKTFLDVPLSIQPRVIFDLRDWYQCKFTAPLINNPATGTAERSIARPTGEARLRATPLAPSDPHWPFAKPVDFVLQTSANGIRGFHGRVRTTTGTLVSRTGHKLTRPTACQLTIRLAGFQQVTVPQQFIPAANANALVAPPIFLYPDATYVYPPGPRLTVLQGLVVDVNQAPVVGANINIALAPGTVGPVALTGVATTDSQGEWFLSVQLPPASPLRPIDLLITATHAGLSGTTNLSARPELFNPVPTITIA